MISKCDHCEMPTANKDLAKLEDKYLCKKCYILATYSTPKKPQEGMNKINSAIFWVGLFILFCIFMDGFRF